MSARRRAVGVVLAVAAVAGPAAGLAQERVGVDASLTGNGRKLAPAGRMTELGNFPTGGAATPDGRFYWAVDAGRAASSVRVVDVATGAVRQSLPIPGGYVGIAFSADGTRAYVSGIAADGTPAPGVKGAGGDVVHVFEVSPRTGAAKELDPLRLPDARDGAAANDNLPPSSGVAAWPEGLDLTADGRYLVVALGQADQVAIIDLKTGASSVANVGRYPYGVVADPRRPRVYVSDERDGTVSVVEVPSGKLLATIPVGGVRGSDYAHAEGLAADPVRDRVYVAVTGRDLVAVIDTAKLSLLRFVDVGRAGAGIGTAPVALAVGPDADTLYVADTGEDAVAAIALERRPPASAAIRHSRVRVRTAPSINHYRGQLARAQRARRAALRGARSRSQRRAIARRYHARLISLQRRWLRGRTTRSCTGPTRRQEAVWIRSVLRALERRARDLRRHPRSRRAIDRRYRAAVARARRRLPKLACPRAGFVPNVPAYRLLGRLPTASYTTDVEVTGKGDRLVWLAAKGLGTGPNNGADTNIDHLMKGRAGVLPRPTDKEMAAFTVRADRQVVPSNFGPPPANTPLLGPGGGPSEKIKHVFYVVRENRTYDQILGSEPRGRGDPRLQVFDDNGVPGPTGGVTPNAHALARKFPLLDNVYANSEESTVGHKITAGGYVNDYTLRKVNSNRGRKGDPDIFPIGNPPNAFVFDQAVRQGLSFHVYGELGASNQPFGDDGRPTFQGVLSNTDPAYPSQVQGTCTPFSQDQPLPNPVRCTADAGDVDGTSGPPATQSRIRVFAADFQQRVAAGTVPSFNYLILFNDHTNGADPGAYTPKANVADNDLALGQLVDLVSHSSIWAESAIFVEEDDSQSGIDSVDAHRIPAFVISPWARRGVVISTRYDQYSFLRTAEMIVGLRSLSLNDALATPLYDAFVSAGESPDVEGTRYTAIQPQQPMTETNPTGTAAARLSAALPWDRVDYVPQELSDRIIWQSVFGAGSKPPPPGPNSSPVEHARATGALRELRAGRSARRWLLRGGGEAEEEEGGLRLATLELLERLRGS